CLAIWDWVFGTLAIPAKDSPHLRFGIEDAGAKRHLPSGLLLEPIRRMMVAILRAVFAPKPDPSQSSELPTPTRTTDPSRIAA
ncbi:MAG TPA: hypothetical protein VLJ39_20810, partial [Tepidisphaeraceae bacterium]|nr:hypothetical protein [Tepidisphaeraceae bacterium]